MLIAQSLRKKNIVEYLLYMWQLEDLFRVFKLDIDLVDKHVISQMKFTDEQLHKQVYQWYDSLIEMMRLENVIEKGHLQINKNVILELDDFHYQLIASAKVPAYNAKYMHVLPLINQLKMKSEAGLSDIELCFNFQYGFLLLKMKGQEISQQTQQTQVEIAKFMVLLSKNYHDHQNGLLELE
jgi:hypothetical protein